MKVTTELDVELECSLVLDGDGIRPLWRAYGLAGFSIEHARDGRLDRTRLVIFIHVRIDKLGARKNKNWRTV